MLRVEQLRIGGLPPLSFSVRNGECLAVEGPSGSGKTRLLRALADLDPSDGHILLDGLSREEAPATEWRKLVRYAAAEPAWWTDTPRGALPSGFCESDRFARLCHALGLAPELADRGVALLSTGERQRFALIRAIADEPRVLLLDEPTAALDAANAALVEELIRFLVLCGRSILLVSHDSAQIARLADARLQLAPPAEAASGVGGRPAVHTP
jgi:ABC-type iron transport system FetAB ATPase subunit